MLCLTAGPGQKGDMETAAASATSLWVVPGGNHAYPHRLFSQGARAQRTSLHRSVLMLKENAHQTGLHSDPESPPLEGPTLVGAAGAPGKEEPGQLAAL